MNAKRLEPFILPAFVVSTVISSLVWIYFIASHYGGFSHLNAGVWLFIVGILGVIATTVFGVVVIVFLNATNTAAVISHLEAIVKGMTAANSEIQHTDSKEHLP